MEALITYMYTGAITIDENNAVDLLRAADLLELTTVKSMTLKHLEEHISFEVSYYYQFPFFFLVENRKSGKWQLNF